MRTARMSHVDVPLSLAESGAYAPMHASAHAPRHAAHAPVHVAHTTAGAPPQATLPARYTQQRITHSVHITRPAFQLYSAWKDLARGQAAHAELHRAACAGFAASAVIKAPCLGDVSSALLVDQIPGLFLAWRSLPQASVLQRGEVWFHQTSMEQFSEVCVILSWESAETSSSNSLPMLKNARAQIEQDLERFKQMMEQ